MKKSILALALTLGVPALVAMAQPAPSDAAVPPAPPRDAAPAVPGTPASVAAPDHAPAPAADLAPRPPRDEPPRGDRWDDRQPPRHDRPAMRSDREGREEFAHRPPPRGEFGADREGGPRLHERGPQHANARPDFPIALIEALDANHDGIIDAKEIERAIDVLRGLDKNHDGVLTRDEFMGPKHHPGPGAMEGRADFRGDRGPQAGPGMPGVRGPEGRFEDRAPGRRMADFRDREPGRGMRGDGPDPRAPMTPGDAPQPPAAPVHPEAPQPPTAPAGDPRG